MNPFYNKSIANPSVKRIFTCLSLCLISGMMVINAQIPAFPGAEGYGKYTSGGRGGAVYEVTNLNDSGPGSLRDAVSQPNRTIVFRVSGNIELQSALFIRESNITIAGQTAPGDGICVRDYPTIIRNANNVIVRYMRFRLGDRYGLKSDALDIDESQNIILDHCTMSWGVDECFTAYGNNNITVQWCIVGEGLKLANHSMGGLWGGYTTYHHNLIHSNTTRHPKYAYTYDIDITDSRNNVIYNWGSNSAYTSPTGRVNLVNNYYKAGPATGTWKHRIVEAEPTKRMYITGNFVAGFPEVTADNWNGGVDPLNGGLPIKYDTPFTVPNPIPEQSAVDAYHEIIPHVGASFPSRDDADNRAIKNLVDSTGSIINRQSDVGGFPRLHSLPPPADSDHDGMPDDYETDLELNPNDASDRNGDKNGNGYTNLEDYINGLPQVFTGLPKPGFVHAEAVAERKINLRWYDHNLDELGFIIERSTDSTAFVLVDSTGANTEEYVDTTVAPLTTYYYRVKSYNESQESAYSYSDGTQTFADGAKPGQAVMISPPNNQGDVSITGTTLRWEKGDYTLSFDVYMGGHEDTLELVASALTGTSCPTGSLSFGTDYFWRIDAKNENGTTTGVVWKFSTVEDAVPELVLYWPFNEEEGNIVYDLTDFENDGTLKNVSTLMRTDGPFGRAISLGNSGAKGHIEVPDNPSISFGDNPFSISFWMRLTSITDSSTYVFHKGAFSAISGTERNGKWFGLEMRDGNFRFSVDDNSTKSVVSSSTSSYVNGEWNHVVIIRDVFSKRLWLYRNNYLSAVVTDNTEDISQAMPLVIGNSDFMHPENYSGDTENAPYRGEIDEFVICRHPFSKDEIDSLYRFNKIPTLPWESTSDAVTTAADGAVLKAYPNPFGQRICLEFDNGVQNHVLLDVYDLNGKRVCNLKKSVIPNTRNRIYWDGETEAGRAADPGMYLIMIGDQNGTRLERVLVIKN